MQRRLIELAAPVEAVVSVAEFKSHLRLSTGFGDPDSEDGLLALYIKAATSAVEARTGLALIERPVRLDVWCWQDGLSERLPMGPASGPVTGEHVLADGTRSPLAPGTVDLRRVGSAESLLVAPNGGPLPTLPSGGHGAFSFTVGFGPGPLDLPGDLRQAILLMATHLYEHRDPALGAQAGMPFAVLALLAPHRAVRI